LDSLKDIRENRYSFLPF